MMPQNMQNMQNMQMQMQMRMGQASLRALSTFVPGHGQHGHEQCLWLHMKSLAMRYGRLSGLRLWLRRLRWPMWLWSLWLRRLWLSRSEQHAAHGAAEASSPGLRHEPGRAG